MFWSITWGEDQEIERRSDRTMSSATMMRRINRIIIPILRQRPGTIVSRRAYTALTPPTRPSPRLPTVFRRGYSTPGATSKACPSCGSPLEMRDIICGNCNSLAPLPEDINYLSLFNLPSTEPFQFDIDLGKLRREFLKIMTKVHPDSVINKSDVFPT
jgi:hypothetical protein